MDSHWGVGSINPVAAENFKTALDDPLVVRHNHFVHIGVDKMPK